MCGCNLPSIIEQMARFRGSDYKWKAVLATHARRTLWCRPPWRIWFSQCPMGLKFFFGRRCAAGRRSAPRARPESWPAVGGLGQQRARPPAGAGSGERARAACMGLREAAVGALRPSGSAGATGGGRAWWTWTRSGAGGRVAGRRRAWSRRGAGRCSVTAGSSSSSAAVVEAAARSRRSSAPELTRDGRPCEASSRRPPEVLHHSARTEKSGR